MTMFFKITLIKKCCQNDNAISVNSLSQTPNIASPTLIDSLNVTFWYTSQYFGLMLTCLERKKTTFNGINVHLIFVTKEGAIKELQKQSQRARAAC